MFDDNSDFGATTTNGQNPSNSAEGKERGETSGVKDRLDVLDPGVITPLRGGKGPPGGAKTPT